MSKPTNIILLPKSHPSPSTWLQLVSRYKAFRLQSLLLSPESFGSTHAREAAFPPERWTSRLANPQANTIIAVNKSPNSLSENTEGDIDLALESEWLASLVITGPLDAGTLASQLHLEESFVDFGEAHRDGEARAQYVLNGMYVIPSARGKGIGVQMLEYAKRFVAAEVKRSGERGRISLIVDYENPPARITYEKCGFNIVHRYWFDDYREGREARTEAAVMMIDLNDDAKV
ncbi:hypothetical protein CkaCkLH20_05367 [Colletotrichum karsti]|uniref:N-acetyltransferase domain-containing protein n=1 Tax=Colletotrichum karsti TaxID=1095194 RepID=A0A9P6IAQ6_9PEZI|nr:uncharacterized protein CkaCkLH20_05367 [Colletotrichum karsti]KAF9877101.1 hypothetical protein CkaCkLH20_05367 [Colletotrichum karsti]